MSKNDGSVAEATKKQDEVNVWDGLDRYIIDFTWYGTSHETDMKLETMGRLDLFARSREEAEIMFDFLWISLQKPNFKAFTKGRFSHNEGILFEKEPTINSIEIDKPFLELRKQTESTYGKEVVVAGSGCKYEAEMEVE